MVRSRATDLVLADKIWATRGTFRCCGKGPFSSIIAGLTRHLERPQVRSGDAVVVSMLVNQEPVVGRVLPNKASELVGGFVAAPDTGGLGPERLQISEIPSKKVRATDDVM